MYLNVFFTPADIAPVADELSARDVFIVIDVIRATTTIATVLGQGAERVLVAPTIERARAAAAKIPGSLLCGERNVRPVAGFDYGNSPSQFAQLDLSGRTMILTTTNGTRAFYACPPEAARLAGSLYNAHAVTERALELARERGGDIHLVCSGELGYFALDDAVCAGGLVLEMLHQQPHIPMLESADAAITLFRAYEPPIILTRCNSARSVIEAGLSADTDFCMQISKSGIVPVVTGVDETTNLLELVRG
ncbi:MAG TPA: 2-phosphosulfolactate phosphatase [Ktedonobacteraceae bacterium]|nr:2-phosphosulfolactate phosphatase [Ktedonobacteraceae bacterium]